MSEYVEVIRCLYDGQKVTEEELLMLLRRHEQEEVREALAFYARKKAQTVFGNRIYARGLIEVSNYCKNDCYYCGIRRSNQKAKRYRLDKEDILSCCKAGYAAGFRTFVMQGGEDGALTDEVLCDIVSAMRKEYPDCAITLSLGERSYESYQRLYEAGANRYLLRHETSNPLHYARLHPKAQTIARRKECLSALKAIGFQTGSGIMVGTPHQSYAHLIEDIRFLRKLQPQMIGIGPFLPHHDTPFAKEKKGSMTLTLTLLSILRLLFPYALLPSTTALGTIHPKGREAGILAGANVVMPNLSPVSVRKNYMLYDDKLCTDEEAAEGLAALKKRMHAIGYEIVSDRGDYKEKSEEESICTTNIHM